jgi:protein ImuB
MIVFSSRRYASVWLRRLSTDRILRRRLASGAPPLEAPLVVAGERQGALRLVAVDDAAAALGLAPGMALADARARHPMLEVANEAAPADAAMLEAVAQFCRRWTPLAAADPPDGIFLDVTGCAHLFGGEAELVADVRKRLSRQGFRVRIAIASTPGTASALARYGAEIVLRTGQERAALATLPLAALRVDAEIAAALAHVGLKRIGDLYDRPRAPLAARFGRRLLDQLDRALDRLEEPISPQPAVARYIAERPFAEPIALEADVLRAVDRLPGQLAAMLERRGEGARRLEFALFRTDGAVFQVEAVTSFATRNPDALAALFAERLDVLRDELDPGFGYDLVRLSVLTTEPVESLQPDLDGNDGGEATGCIFDRIGARMGIERVAFLRAIESHVPERAVLTVPLYRAGTAAAHWETEAPGPPARPLRLLLKPEPIAAVAMVPDGPPVRFRWRRVLHEVVRAQGPERIAAEWWREGERPTRDYYRVEDSHGRRFWLFREGLFGREFVEPRWFLHGTFA